MAIIKQAKNLTVTIRKTHLSISKEREIVAKKIFIHSTQEDLELNSNKKIIMQSNKE